MDEVSRLWSKLQRLLRHRGRSREDTEDLIQDAFLRMHTYCNTYEVHEREACLVRTAINLDVDQQRRERHRSFVPVDLEELSLANDAPELEEMIDVDQHL